MNGPSEKPEIDLSFCNAVVLQLADDTMVCADALVKVIKEQCEYIAATKVNKSSHGLSHAMPLARLMDPADPTSFKE